MAVNGARANIDVDFQLASPALPAVATPEQAVLIIGPDLRLLSADSISGLSPTPVYNSSDTFTIEMPDILTGNNKLISSSDNLVTILLKFGTNHVTYYSDNLPSGITITVSNGFVTKIEIAGSLVANLFPNSTYSAPARVYVGGTYLSTDLASKITPVTSANFDIYFGSNISGPSTPLAWAVKLALTVNDTLPVYVVALDSIDTTTLNGSYNDYVKALNYVMRDELSYYIIPLTRNEGVIDYMKAFLKAAATKRREKFAILAPELPTTEAPTEIGQGTGIDYVPPIGDTTFTDTVPNTFSIYFRPVEFGTTHNDEKITFDINATSVTVTYDSVAGEYTVGFPANQTVKGFIDSVNSSGVLQANVDHDGLSYLANTLDNSSAPTDALLSGGENKVKYVNYNGSTYADFDSANGTYKDVVSTLYLTIAGFPEKFSIDTAITTPAAYSGGIDEVFNGIIIASDAINYGNPVTEDVYVYEPGAAIDIVNNIEDRDKAVDYGIAYVQQFAYARIVLLWGDKVTIYDVDHDLTYAAVILAAEMSSLGPNFSLTEYPVPIISAITGTNDTFSDNDQLADLRSYGWWVLVKDSPSSPVKTSLQYTTDVSSLKMAESTTIRCLDAIAKRIRATLRPILARYDVNSPTTISDVVTPSTKAVIDSILADKLAIDVQITKVYPSTVSGEEDTMIVEGTVTIGQPMNRLKFTFLI